MIKLISKGNIKSNTILFFEKYLVFKNQKVAFQNLLLIEFQGNGNGYLLLGSISENELFFLFTDKKDHLVELVESNSIIGHLRFEVDRMINNTNSKFEVLLKDGNRFETGIVDMHRYFYFFYQDGTKDTLFISPSQGMFKSNFIQKEVLDEQQDQNDVRKLNIYVPWGGSEKNEIFFSKLRSNNKMSVGNWFLLILLFILFAILAFLSL